MIRLLAAFSALLVLLGSGASLAEEQSPRARAVRLLYEAAVADPGYGPAFEAFLATLHDDGRGHYILEGDLLLTRDQLRTYLEDLGKSEAALESRRAGELVMATSNGQLSKWPKGKRTLSYWVDRASFRTPAEADGATADLEKAARAWETSCPECETRFVRLDEARKAEALFVFRYVAGPRPIARAFFPHDPPVARAVEVFTPFFAQDLGFDRVGVLRHELGHTLGYRHEHTRGVNGCFYEDDEWVVLTPYDSQSVMHYLCGGAGNAQLTISTNDAKGHQCAYLHEGPPCPQDTAARR